MGDTPDDGSRPPGVDAIRARIDALDEQIQALISERAALAQTMGGSKRAQPPGTREFYRPEREAQVLRGVVRRNAGPLRDEEMVRLFREIMSACLAQQEPLKVAFLGPEGTFTQAAVLKHFGHSVRALSLATIDEVFHEVESGVADFGVVPVENSTEGVVSNTLDMLTSSPLKICGEVELRIRQHLMGRMQSVDEIRRIYSHQQSLAQCRAWIEQKLGDVECRTVSSNAEAARRARDEEGAAAIAGDTAAEIYGLHLIMTNIEDKPDNTTRFLVMGREIFPSSGNDKTSLLMSGRHQAGALQELLYPLAKHRVSMTRIESRPSRRAKWDYVFFVDVEGHAEDPNVAAALKDLEVASAYFRVLGSYPCAVL
jgi:chorismate mutase/prephenate dehydratase